MRNIGNRNPEADVPPTLFLDRNRVIEIPGRFAVNGNRQMFAQINPLCDFFLGNDLRNSKGVG